MFNFNKKLIFIFLSLFIFVFIGNVSIAQEVSNSDNLDVSVTPKNPSPGENVNIILNSYSLNLDTSKIIWYVDGVVKKEGVAQKDFTVKAKGIGQPSTVKVVVSTKEGNKTESTIEINPSTLSLIIEPISYTPLFYKGKPSFSAEGSVKVVAMAEITNPATGKRILPENLIYKWIETGIVKGSSSGLGKNSIIIKESISTSNTPLTLEIYDSSNNFILSTSKELVSSDPEIIFYENNPLYGILYNKSLLQNYFLGNRDEITITAEPFFFDKKENILSNLSYTWKVNGTKIEQPDIKNEVILRRENKEIKGRASISLSVGDPKTLFQFTNNNIYINYGE